MGFLLTIILGLYVYSLSKRVGVLEKELRDYRPKNVLTEDSRKNLEALGITPSAAQIETVRTTDQSTQGSTTFSPIPKPNTYVYKQDASEDENPLLTWIKEDFFVKTGALLLLIAGGWFVSYAFANNWIGPIGRISLGLLVGTLCMVIGVVRFPKSASQGSIFAILGSSFVLLTIAAARELYGFFTPTSALGIMFLAVVFIAFLSIRQQRQSLAVASLIMGAIAPTLTAAEDPSLVSLSFYLLLLVGGTLWVVALTRSTILTPLSIAIVSLYSLLYIDLSFEEQLQGLLFSFVFTTVFFLGNIFSMFRRERELFSQSHIITAFATGVYLLTWIVAAAPDTWQTLLYVLWMLIFAAGAFVVLMRTNEPVPFYIYSAVALGLLGAATANEFDGALLTIAATVEIMALVLVAHVFLKNTTATHYVSSLLLIPIVFSVEHIVSGSWRAGVLHADFAALLVIMGAFILAGSLLKGDGNPDSTATSMKYGAFVIGAGYGLTLVWLILHATFTEDIATTCSLIIYTIIGITLYVSGRIESEKQISLLGAALLGGVIVRLMVVEIWDMELVTRIVTFVVIGVMLLSTAFIKKGNKQ